MAYTAFLSLTRCLFLGHPSFYRTSQDNMQNKKGKRTRTDWLTKKCLDSTEKSISVVTLHLSSCLLLDSSGTFSPSHLVFVMHLKRLLRCRMNVKSDSNRYRERIKMSVKRPSLNERTRRRAQVKTIMELSRVSRTLIGTKTLVIPFSNPEKDCG